MAWRRRGGGRTEAGDGEVRAGQGVCGGDATAPESPPRPSARDAHTPDALFYQKKTALYAVEPYLGFGCIRA